MQLVFEVRERRAGPGDVAVFPLRLYNDSDRPTDCSYRVTAEEDGFDTGWCRLSAPVRMGPGAREPAELQVRLPEGRRGPELFHVRVQVRTDVSGDAEDTCLLEVRAGRCARFALNPTLEINPDGTVTASIGVLNCGDVELDCSVDLRHEDGWLFQVDDGQLTLNVGVGPVEVSYTFRPPIGKRPSQGDEVAAEITVDGLVLAQASARLQGPPPKSAWGKKAALVGVPVVLLLVLGAWGVVSALGGDDDSDDPTPSTATITVAPTRTAPPGTAGTTSSSRTTTSSTVVAPSFEVVPTSVTRFPATITVRNTGSRSIAVLTPRLTGADAEDFSIGDAQTTCPSRLAPGESCEVEVTFGTSSGRVFQATLEIPVQGAATPGRVSLRVDRTVD